MSKRGILFVNLGSPNSTSVQDVRKYLRTFLMDPDVIDIPILFRWILVNLIILPRRPVQTAKAYQKIWTDKGSPLVCNSQKLVDLLSENLNTPIELAMRYENPSIENALDKLYNKHKVQEVILFPLYPHYADSTIKTAISHTRKVIRENNLPLSLTVHPVFYNHEDYIEALVRSASWWLNQEYDHLVFSYHGLPKRHLMKSDPTKKHCLQVKNCCKQRSIAQETCYYYQVHETTKRFIEKANIPKTKYTVAFQSKVGRAQWLSPATSDVLNDLAKKKLNKVLIICPSFVADCLETLEEINIQEKNNFIKAGGGSLELIPCLNYNSYWVKVLTAWLAQYA